MSQFAVKDIDKYYNKVKYDSQLFPIKVGDEVVVKITCEVIEKEPWFSPYDCPFKTDCKNGFAFGNDPENLTVFGVVASPTDGFAAIQVTGSGKKTEEKFDWQALFRKILAIVMIFVAVLVIVWLIGKLGEIGQAKTNREIRKYLKNQKKNQNRRK